ncbi:hypothetical protein J6590_008603 [Homalodisca vitripennis]|nr:hypothetical protein J6590_008603 [Homalodisca vitripennis]
MVLRIRNVDGFEKAPLFADRPASRLLAPTSTSVSFRVPRPLPRSTGYGDRVVTPRSRTSSL